MATKRDIGATIRVRGIVQGVGFRPFVYRLAQRHRLRGTVRNDAGGVVIEVVGALEAIERLTLALQREAPPAAAVEEVSRSQAPELVAEHRRDFRIVQSRADAEATLGVSPDLASCPECLVEIADPDDRRYRYAFTNCTNCGPRLSILEGVPYDRPKTTMTAFAMCAACEREYRDPGDRRFHAQPNACPACGPSLCFESFGDGSVHTDWSAIHEAFWELIWAGGSIAMKGIGGYHLACLATDEAAVQRLRARKHRPHKPLAIMARSVDALRRHCVISPLEELALGEASAPIVLLRPSPKSSIAAAVAPAQHRIGAMLPYSPLHHLLFEDRDEVLVMTSGNLSDRPQIIADGEARATFGGIADAILGHDRRIAVRVDDSVVRFDGRARTSLRLGRGFAPVRLPAPPGLEGGRDLVAMGAQLKATFCLKRGNRLVLSQHIGDLDHAENLEAFETSLERDLRLWQLVPEAIAIDQHPDIASGRISRMLAKRCGATLIEVQHHHGHAAACLAEHGWPVDAAPVLAIVLDGLGYGPDGSLWGGEFLAVDYAGYRRLAHLCPIAMPGGAAAIREPWRMAAAHLATIGDLHELRQEFQGLALFRSHPREQLHILLEAARRGINAPMTSSCGRLFDAVAALIGLRERVTYEGQAAAELEATLWRDRSVAKAADGYAMALAEQGDALPVIDPQAIWRPMLADLAAGRTHSEVALKFHVGLVDALSQMTEHLLDRHSELRESPIVLSGGVFQNGYLLRALRSRLARRGRSVLTHRMVPPNDGGLAVGQAAVAAAVAKGLSTCA